MSLRDWIELALLIVLTFFTISRWIYAREYRDTDLTAAYKRLQVEQERLGSEQERQRTRWHQELAPWQQEVVRRLTIIETQMKGNDESLSRIWVAIHRGNRR